MAKFGKKYQEVAKLVEKDKQYDPGEAIALVRKTSTTKFDASVEVAVKLGVDPKYPDQQVRGAVVLPHGTGKTQSVLVFAKGEKAKEAETAGADFVGAEDLVDKIKDGWTEFDVAVATPDMMGLVGRLGKILGPKGLMPNPKVGTVTLDVARAINEIKAGKIEYRTDKAGNIHAPIGKVSFDEAKLEENFITLIETLIKVKPSGAKGQYMKKIALSTTMGPAVYVNTLKATVAKKD